MPTDTSRTNIPGVTASTAIDVDWGELGETFATLDSDQQAAFFRGMGEALTAMPGNAGNMQLAYIATAPTLGSSGRLLILDLAGYLDA